MVLIDLLTEEGGTGCSYLFCPTPLVLEPVAKLLANLAPVIEGDLLAPVEIERKLQMIFPEISAHLLAVSSTRH